MHLKKPLRYGLAVLASASLLLAACGDNKDDSGGSTDTGGERTSELDFSEVSITIGSKDFTENKLVAEMFAQAIEAGGGTVDRKIDLGGTNVNREALEAGEIDAYPEYNGTGWTVHLGHDDPSSDPDELYQVTADEDLEKNDIHWLGRSDLSNTYGFATGPALTDENGGAFDFDSMAAHLKENPDATVCMESEFPGRPDGLILFEEATGFEIPRDQHKIMDTGIIYNETAKGECDFGEIFTTDGRITELDLSIVDDDNAMIIYNLSLTVNDDVFQQAPEALTELAETILDDLTAEEMAQMNYEVDGQGKSLADVVKPYLSGLGLI